MLLAGCVTKPINYDYSYTTPVSEIPFAAIDLETTGLNSKTDRIVEIGIVKFLNGKVIAERSWLINPGIPIPPSAVKVHGITTEMVSSSPAFAVAFPEIASFIGKSVILAHNARFDIAFMKSEMKLAGQPAPRNIVIDTLPVFRQWFPEMPRHSIELMVKSLELNQSISHRGLTDAYSLYAIFRKGVKARPSSLMLADLIKTSGGEEHFWKRTNSVP